jgi:hypothetical protein
MMEKENSINANFKAFNEEKNGVSIPRKVLHKAAVSINTGKEASLSSKPIESDSLLSPRGKLLLQVIDPSNGEVQWKKRYFEINGTVLLIHKVEKGEGNDSVGSASNNGNKLIAAISLQHASLVERIGDITDHIGIGYLFALEVREKKYIVRAKSDKEANDWVSYMRTLKLNSPSISALPSPQDDIPSNRMNNLSKDGDELNKKLLFSNNDSKIPQAKSSNASSFSEAESVAKSSKSNPTMNAFRRYANQGAVATKLAAKPASPSLIPSIKSSVSKQNTHVKPTSEGDEVFADNKSISHGSKPIMANSGNSSIQSSIPLKSSSATFRALEPLTSSTISSSASSASFAKVSSNSNGGMKATSKSVSSQDDSEYSVLIDHEPAKQGRGGSVSSAKMMDDDFLLAASM